MISIDTQHSIVVDVREADERASVFVPGAVHAPLSGGIASVVSRLREIPEGGLVLCAVGQRSGQVVAAARDAGLDGWSNVDGGLDAWAAAGGELVSGSTDLSSDDMIRFERQISLPEVGVAGQVRLAAARVLIIGAGGLGAPASMFLAAAGVGTIGLVDGDVVDRSNLHRQLLYDPRDCGSRKVEAARDRLVELSPTIDVPTWACMLDAGSVDSIFADRWDLVLDCTDSIPARYVLAAAGARHDVAIVHGSVYRYEGRVTVAPAGGAPCWQCIHPTAPTGALAPSCSDAGVLGVVPGIVGTLQAAEALKLILDLGRPLTGSLLIYDMLTASIDTIELRADPACSICGTESLALQDA
jgi:molybdopterin/thiamine biosynthesis adenylyltransferase/rhodanese-related sulfurtransferase